MLIAINKNLNVVKSNLEENFATVQRWFYENHVAVNSGKCRFMLIDNHDERNQINLNGTDITSSTNEKLLRVFIDKN